MVSSTSSIQARGTGCLALQLSVYNPHALCTPEIKALSDAHLHLHLDGTWERGDSVLVTAVPWGHQHRVRLCAWHGSKVV